MANIRQIPLQRKYIEHSARAPIYILKSPSQYKCEGLFLLEFPQFRL